MRSDKMVLRGSDLFGELPAKIRIQVLASMQCQSMILRLIEASPIMLQQYLLYKKEIIRQVLAAEFDEDLIQDAMVVILFPRLRESIPESLAMGPSQVIRSHIRDWTNFQLPDPLKGNDHHLIDQLNRLHSKAIALAEDYITKATATPWAYVCLPEIRQSSAEGHLMFKGAKVAPRFNFGKLTSLERRRFMKAFLTYELLSKASVIRFIPIILSQRKASYAEFETVACIHRYFSSLYGAIMAQCTDAEPPSASTEQRLPDTFCFDANQHAPKLDFKPSSPFRNHTDREYDYAAYVSTLGLDCLTRLLHYDMANPVAREQLKVQLQHTWSNDCQSRPWEWDAVYNYFFERQPESKDGSESFMYRDLSFSHTTKTAVKSRVRRFYTTLPGLQHKIRQQRAWAFFRPHLLLGNQGKVAYMLA